MNTRKTFLSSLLILLSFAGYLMISYGIERSSFGIFISLYAILFIAYYVFIDKTEGTTAVKWILLAAIGMRLVLIFALPNFSDDFYRFIWDGNLLAHGISPFEHTPQFYMKHGLPDFLSADLFHHLNSQPYYSIYPPVCQFVYFLSAAIFGTALTGNVVIMKLVMIATEAGSLWVMRRLLNHFNLPMKYLLIYALNPLIILNLTGNLHFEGLMIFFLLFSYYAFLNKRWWWASIGFTLAVNTKLIPLILLPYLVFSLGWKRSFQLIGVLGFGTLLLHLPFLNPAFFGHFADSLGLYFHSFEYNASLFYVVRWIGFYVKGYDIIHTAAPRLSAISTVIILIVSWFYRKKSLHNLPIIYSVILTIYLLFSTTVHPWYITSLIAFVPLAGFWYPLAWAAVIPLTYITYITPAYHQNFGLIALEYAIVFAVMGYDFYRRKKPVDEKMRTLFFDELEVK